MKNYSGKTCKAVRAGQKLFQMTKKVIILVAATLLSVASAFAQCNGGTIPGSSITWNITGSTLTISGTGVMPTLSSTSYPWFACREYINALIIESSVDGIGNEAFIDYYNFTNVTIKDNLTNFPLKFVGGWGFSGTHFKNSPIETLYLGRNIVPTWNGNNGSNHCPFTENLSLKTVTIGEEVTGINANSFKNCIRLKTLNMGNNLKSIDNDAFNGCDSLETPLNLPQGFKTIGAGAFFKCRNLPSITIPSSVDEIGNQAFNMCSKLKTVEIKDNLTNFPLKFVGGWGFSGTHFENSPIETLYLGRNIVPTWNGNNGSNHCPFTEKPSLKTVTIGEEVTDINANSFYNCVSLKTLILGSNLETIGNDAFNGCDILETPLTLPQGFKSIGSGTFFSCRNLPSIFIPKSTTDIGNQAFNNCKKLIKVEIEDNLINFPLKFVGGWGFSGTHFENTPIETLYLGRNIVKDWDGNNGINNCPFKENSALKTLTIGKNVTIINDKAFYGCCELEEIICNPTEPPTIYENTFGGCGKSIPNCKLYIPNCLFANNYSTYWKWSLLNIFAIGSTTPCSVSIDDILASQLQIFPNPALSEIFIKSDLQIEKVEIYSISGALLITENNFNEKISVSDLASGIYFLKVHTDKGLVNSKFVKE